jgi:hypothetical protein
VFLSNQTAWLELRDLERALAGLPEEQRSVVLLVGLDGMKYEDAAAVVNSPIGTVRSRIARGRENLRTATGLFPARHAQTHNRGDSLVSVRSKRPREKNGANATRSRARELQEAAP